ncbi:MAG: hypothetical protein A2648_01770 [Candidatus Lloydbacteria bacterium RIFCSPHIGHO2_01_FULL_41_20]|uniref:DOD-type homing endonuclease domain-containing protein n=1 Tax=Candidatus Lloydbacteria bacterium RIFCSPHIGHO2_01_FULL_41_20 TaxID=1798657 RepID=A0A1G2CT85_9BACT|nr:MAG: hypothetical protein A2648_01770 [Candidatus Lloydbacteria bacterium RIFCSPHIGHO2_01_FULL_41_20]
MGKRGTKPKGKVKIKWSANFAYAIGLLVSDGCLYNDSRHISLVSKDKEMIDNFQKALSINCNVGKKAGSASTDKKYFNLQIGDVLFYKFLVEIGLTSAKSKNIGGIDIPPKYFFSFLRGSFDGDGTFYSYFDSRWKSSFMFYTVFISASKKHIDWLREEIKKRLKIKGHLTGSGKTGTAYQLKYAKKESLKILKNLYYSRSVICLSRKRLKIEKALSIVGERL